VNNRKRLKARKVRLNKVDPALEGAGKPMSRVAQLENSGNGQKVNVNAKISHAVMEQLKPES